MQDFKIFPFMLILSLILSLNSLALTLDLGPKEPSTTPPATLDGQQTVY